jgi:NADH:ubiquinone reductase (H+-translocating)
MSINIKRNQLKRVVIVGGGLGGLRLAEDLSKANLQVVLIDKNNFHQFPPLIYQIASAGIDPSSISFPFRQIFRKRKNFYFRMAEARAVFPDKKILQTSIGKIEYDYLVFAAGTTTNFYGNANIEKWAIPMKTVSEAMGLRNAVLSNLERALTCATEEDGEYTLTVCGRDDSKNGYDLQGWCRRHRPPYI